MKDASLLCQVSCHASHTDVQHPFCVLIHAVEFGTASAHHPDNFVAIHEEGLVLLLEEGEFLVGEEVAEEFALAAHAEGSEGVACAGGAEGELAVQLVSIEIGMAGVFLHVQVLNVHYLLVDGGHGVVGCFDDDVLPVHQRSSAFSGEHLPAFVESMQHVFHLCLVEAEGRERLVKDGDGGGVALQFGDMDVDFSIRPLLHTFITSARFSCVEARFFMAPGLMCSKRGSTSSRTLLRA